MRRWCPSSLLKSAARSSNLFIERSRNSQLILHGSDLSSSSCFCRSPVIGSWSTDHSPLSVSPSHLEACRTCGFHYLKGKHGDSSGLPSEASDNLRFSSSSSSGSPSPWASTFLSVSSRSVWSRRQERGSRVRSRGLSSAAEQSAETDATTTAGGEVSQKVVEIVDEVTRLTLMEVADLTEVLRKKFGVDEMPMMEVMMPGMGMGGVGGARAGGAKAEEKKAEKTAFDLKLESFDAASKIKIIKEVRTFTDLGLKEAKDLVEKTPTLLKKKGVLKEEAEKIIEKMKAVGANVVME